ncbi:diguanylate cyclase [Ensifer sp. T173]|jgi:diguanylate cyclase (GGDEF)-like protein|uniref:diguanylate cyclase n=1 Tax=Ensifer canadensis TaxID=555315 RepID=A0AAW4FFE2_9HYPH|nr:MULTISPECIES: GGDEF domain-containing protein [Ensifer]KQU84194.1 diguanylate cyclase [Ensifer sp. Root31]KQW75353.1 diguanylate cyclase [Ensifer sp. Root127]KQY66899.1 diguanylate cyclase [Ensifer sp. Root142]MBM3089245.1 diguanylate cyclase [Ensifer canadensis]NOV14529.1 GGDEF domain-containing protein [Ensifer canadensis]
MTAQLDLATVLLLHKSSFLVGALCFLYLRWQSPRNEGLGILAAGFLFLALASTLSGYGEQKLLPAILWTLSSFTLGLGGYALFWIGLRRLSGQRRHRADWLALAIPLTGAIAGLITHFHVINSIRASAFNTGAFLFLAASAFAVVADRKSEPLPVRTIFAASLAIGATLCLAVVVGLLKPDILPITTTYAFFLLIISHFAIALFALVLVKERAEAALRRTADTDMLTGVGNRRWFLSQLPRFGWKGDALAVMDLDFFKRINDRYGHQAGDQVLIAFAELVRANLRATDCFARLGGEEFGLYLPKTNEVQARAIVERLRLATEQLHIHCDGQRIAVSVSIGFVVGQDAKSSWEELFSMADAALYQAKDAGRNCIVAYAPPPASFAIGIPIARTG